MVEYLDGGRIQASINASVSANYTGWKEFSRHTLDGNADKLQVSSLPQSRYFMVLAHIIPESASSQVSHVTLDDETGSSYAERTTSYNGAEVSGNTNRFFTTHSDKTIESGGGRFITFFMTNPETKDKFLIGRCTESNTTGTSTDSLVMISGVGRTYAGANSFDNTWSQSIEIINDESGGFGSGSELVVLEYDESQTDTSGQFWEQLADVELSSAGNIIDSGTFTAKKYIWYQIYKKTDSGSPFMEIRFNNDSTTDIYKRRYEEDGGSSTTAKGDELIPTSTAPTEFVNGFLLNTAGKEKLTHGDYISSGSDTNVPNRWRWCGKWVRTSGSGTGNASSQVTRIQADNGNSSNSAFASGSWIKVWGHD